MTDAAQFFLDRYQAEVPTKIHSRDTAENGNPEWHRSFESWLTDGEGGWQTHSRDDTEFCNHPTRETHCSVCDGTGLRVKTRHVYRHPAKWTLETRLKPLRVAKGRPRLDEVLEVFAANDGDYGLTIAALRSTYSIMWDKRLAVRHIDFALREFQRCYVEQPPTYVPGRSDAQLDAEVAA